MSTTRSQLYRFARDLGNVEAVEHGYRRGGLSAQPAAQPNAKRAGSSTGKAIARSIISSALSASGHAAARPSSTAAPGRSPCARGLL